MEAGGYNWVCLFEPAGTDKEEDHLELRRIS